jgi:divalent metal cation (Fe/Co/Zn/Cd) transporter
MESKALPLVVSPAPPRRQLVARARLLAWLGIGWHAIEAVVAIGAGIVAGSIALVGFGADSVVESIAGLVLLWRFGGDRHSSEAAERRAYRLIGVSFYVIAAYVAIEAARQLIDGAHPEVSWVGIGLAAVTLLAMPPLARAKARVAEQLHSAATRAEGRQNMLCAYLSAALLVGLGANAIAGWWWADPITALVIAAVAIREGRDSWRGEGCCEAC